MVGEIWIELGRALELGNDRFILPPARTATT